MMREIKHGFGSSVAMSSSSPIGTVMFGASQDHVWSNRIDFVGLASFLRRIHPSKTPMHVSADTGLPPDSVKKWLSGEVQPNGRAMLALVCAYGPDFISASVKNPPAWCNRDLRAANIARLEAELEEARR